MHVIGHEAVRNDVECFPVGGLQNQRPGEGHTFGILEESTPRVSAERQRVSMRATVIEAAQVDRMSWSHVATTEQNAILNRTATNPAKAGSPV
jgi:hypothetical protein